MNIALYSSPTVLYAVGIVLVIIISATLMDRYLYNIFKKIEEKND